MKSRSARLRLCLIVLVLMALAGPVRGQSPPFAWWKDVQFQKDLGLTTELANRVDAVFRAAIPQLRQYRNELDAQEAELSRLIEVDSDEKTIARQVDRVEVIRANLNKNRTLMFVHMRQLLSREQRVKFRMLHERWERDHRPQPRRDNSK